MLNFRRLILAAAVCGAWAPGALAQDVARASSVQELALYKGADRQARLVEAARREGELSVYHAYPRLTVMLDAFSKKYGIKVKSWRAVAATMRTSCRTTRRRTRRRIAKNCCRK